jgi:MFS family permease
MLARYTALGYFAGATSARTADEMSAPALLLAGLAIAGSARTAALLYSSLTLTAAAGGPPLGALLDRSRRPGRLLTGALAGYAAGLAAITLSVGHLPVILLIAAASGTGFLAPALTGGWTSRLADVVPAAELSRGHALDAATYNVAGLAGPALAGLIAAAAGARWAMAAAITLLVLAAPAAAGMPARTGIRAGSRAPAHRELARDLRAGAAAIVRIPALRRITMASTVAYLGTGMFVVACPLLGRRYLGGAADGALLLAVLASTSLVATAATARWPLRPRPDTVFVIATAIAGCGLAALAFAPGAALIITLVALIGLADGPQLAGVFAVRQREAPPRLRGQIFTTAASMKISAGALGAALAGALAANTTTIMLVAAAATQGAALLLYLTNGRVSGGMQTRPRSMACAPRALRRTTGVSVADCRGSGICQSTRDGRASAGAPIAADERVPAHVTLRRVAAARTAAMCCAYAVAARC